MRSCVEGKMDLLKGNIKSIYFRYLAAAFGSALIAAVYGVVDMAMVGQYHGPIGTAALAVVAPIWNIVYSLGLLTGVGGSILLAQEKGKKNEQEGNAYFSATFLLTIVLAGICWIAISLFDTQMLCMFGAKEDTLPLAKQYLIPIKFVIPAYLFNQMLSAFLRNDNAPGLATGAVLFGGVLNIFGDYFFVFGLDLGIIGAGIATAIGAVVTLLIMCIHFKSQKNTLSFKMPKGLCSKTIKVTQTGFATFVIDMAMGVLTIFFNRQIVTFIGTNALAVYGVIVNVSTIVQCCAYSVGQAGQPLISMNFGANNKKRVNKTLSYMIFSAGVFGIIWTILAWVFPNGFIRIFMDATEEIFQIAPSIIRTYGLSFLILPFNVFSTYYFQSVAKPGVSLIVAMLRGIVISGILIFVLPYFFGGSSIWFTMVITEALVAGYVALKMVALTR